MAKRTPLTYEEKKSIPRHLRGAGVVRFKCKHCGSWHRNPTSLCKKNPDYEKNREKQRAAAREFAAKSFPAMIEGRRKRWELKSNRQKAAQQMIERNKKRAAKGLYKGENNPFYGRKHTPQTRLKMSKARERYLRDRLRAETVEAVGNPTFTAPAHHGTFPPRVQGTNRDEFSHGVTHDAWSDEFDPFG